MFTGQIPAPESIALKGRVDYTYGIVAAVIAFVVYLTCLPPTVSGEDSGELITAVYSLGIPHPPGYPVWCILTYPFVFLPFGTVAWRVALSSAVFGTVAVFLIYLLTLTLSKNRVASASVTLLFGFSQAAWEQFVIAEVYALNTLFLAACCLLLIVWYESRRGNSLLLFAFIYGLSLANHSTMRLLGPAFLVFILSVDPVPWKRWMLYVACLGLALLGLMTYLYLPLRSLANPPVDWGDPETWENFWAVIRQDQYSFLLTQQERSLSLFWHQLRMFLDYYSAAFTPGLAAIPLLGIYPLWKSNRHLFGFLGGLALLLSLGMVLVLNYGTDRTAIVVNDVFFIPFEMTAAVLAGIGLAWLTKLRVGALPLRPVAWVVSAAAVIVPAFWHYRMNDRSDYWFAHDYAHNVLTTLEPNAIYIPSADHATFPVLYLQAVEGQRSDVTIADKYGYIDRELYMGMPAEIRETFDRIPTKSQRRTIEEWIVSRTDRPVYFTEKRTFPASMSVRMENAGLLYRAVENDDAWQSKNTWDEYVWNTLDLQDAGDEFTAGMVLSDYYFARGRDYIASGDMEKGEEQFELSANASHEAPEGLNNIGTALAEAGHLEKSTKYYLRSVEADDKYVIGLRNLGQVYMSLQKYSAALLVFGRLMAIDSVDVQSHFQYAASLIALGRVGEAKDELLAMTKSRPDDARVWRELGMLYLDGFSNERRGRDYLAKSLKLDPNQSDLARILDDPGADPLQAIPGLPDIDSLTNPLTTLPGLRPR